MTINTVATDAQMRTVFNLTRFEMGYPQFRFDTVTKLLHDVMLPEIHARMAALYFSPKIIKATRIENIKIFGNGNIRYQIVSDYKSEDGFDVSRAREEGTKRHFIAPTKKLALSWLAGYVRLFSKGHWVRGIRKSNVIKKTRKRMEPKIQKMLDDATDSYYIQLVAAEKGSGGTT